MIDFMEHFLFMLDLQWIIPLRVCSISLSIYACLSLYLKRQVNVLKAAKWEARMPSDYMGEKYEARDFKDPTFYFGDWRITRVGHGTYYTLESSRGSRWDYKGSVGGEAFRKVMLRIAEDEGRIDPPKRPSEEAEVTLPHTDTPRWIHRLTTFWSEGDAFAFGMTSIITLAVVVTVNFIRVHPL